MRLLGKIRSSLLFPLLLASSSPAAADPLVGDLNDNPVRSSNVASFENKRFLHLTDIHYDPYYVPTTDPDTSCHRGTQAFTNLESIPAQIASTTPSHYGVRGSGCDSPLPLVEETFHEIHANIVNKTGVDFVLWTGDSSRHDRDKGLPRDTSEVISQNAEIVYYMRRTFNLKKTVIVPSIGNWDVWPANTLGADAGGQFRRLYEAWKSVLEPSQNNEEEQREIHKSFTSGGYFERTLIPNKVSAISLNTLYWFKENPSIDDCTPLSEPRPPAQNGTRRPGDEHFDWLTTKLSSARLANRKVFIVGHIPPSDSFDSPLYKPSCYEQFVQISGDYADVILGQYYGHVNKDVISVVIKTKLANDQEGPARYKITAITEKHLRSLSLSNDQSVVGTIKTSSSIVPIHNPAFRAGILELPPSSAPYLLRESQYAANLLRANERHHKNPGSTSRNLKYDQGCLTDKHYKMPDLTPASYTDWIRRMREEEGLKEPSATNSEAGSNGFLDPNLGGKKPKKDKRMLHIYTLCMDANDNLPSTDPDSDGDHLVLTPLLVNIIFSLAIIAFLGSLLSFWMYIRTLEGSSEQERQRLLFQPVSRERLRRVQWEAGRIRERGVDVYGTTI
ncbi:Metallo-dependent phosphatase-like protein [Phlyctochytrium arcticum]|nr:Metallo-dependent phosphatase-like protein [Phlyctochytrium arcticum]